MISVLIAAAALLAQQAPATAAVTTRVQGTVVNSLNGEAVPKIIVILRAPDEEHLLSYADETDANGHFLFDDVEPGEYAIVVEHPGFVVQSTGSTGAPPPSVKVERNQQINDVMIRLTPLGAISGRVLDADGEPIRQESMDALQYGYTSGKKELKLIAEVQSGDDGRFRFFGLRAGTFYLKATGFRQPQSGTYLHDSGPTYYPGTTDEGHAAPIVLQAGAQREGFDLRLQSTGFYSVHFEFPGGQAPKGSYDGVLTPDQGPRLAQFTTASNTDVIIMGVPAGSYEAVVTMSNEEKKSYALQHVEVVNGDVHQGMTLVPAVEVAGRVRIEGGATHDLAPLRINLQSQIRNPLLPDRASAVNPDGSFLLKDAAPVAYDLTINRGTGVYLKSVRMGDKQLPDRRIDLSTKQEPLTVVLGADVGEVEGSVRNATGDPVARARVNVIAYGDDASRTDFDRFGFTDEKGEFKIRDVPPGEYKVFAWEDVPEGAPEDPEFRKPFEKQAASIKMQPNGHEKVSVTAISAAQVDRSSQ